MSRYTVAYSAFTSRLAEIETLLTMAKALEQSDPIANALKINAICRGAIVLLCSHVEGYTKELGELTLAKLSEQRICRSKIPNTVAFHISKNFIAEIKDTADTSKIADHIFNLIDSDLSFWSSSGPLEEQIPEDRFNKGFASPSFKKISAYLRRFGYADYKRDLGFKLNGDFQVCKTLIDHMVDTRNKIAHGNPTTSKTPSDLIDAVQTTRLFCRATDDVFASWCRANLCTIR
jgi:hypothetical protein